MFGFDDTNIDKEKCYTTIGELPPFIDPEHPPTKKQPFSAVVNHPFVHSTELILPEEIYDRVWDSIESKISGKGQYARVMMPLSAILEGDFFNRYIKIGNILMISEGRSVVDNVYSLKNGILRLELDKASYEKAGLVGTPIRSGGRKHVRSRYVVEANLRLPSMLHGKKGFERIVRACKNVLNNSISWLFCDLASPSSLLEEDSPIKQHHPQILSYAPSRVALPRILVPELRVEKFSGTENGHELRDSCTDIQEWLGLVALDSPRIRADDRIDPYLSRYEVSNRDDCRTSNLVKVSWRGLIPPAWVMKMLIATIRSCASPIPADSTAWFAITSSALGKGAVESKDGYTILALLQQADGGSGQFEEPSEPSDSQAAKTIQRKFISWEYVGNTYWGI